MKRIYLLLAVIFLAIIITAAVLFSQSFRTVNYTNDLAGYLAAAVQKNTLRAEYDGQEKMLTNLDVDGVLTVLRRGSSELKAVGGAPETYDGKITLYADDLTLTLYRADQKVDSVIMERRIGGRGTFYQLDGYQMFKWLLNAVGF